MDELRNIEDRETALSKVEFLKRSDLLKVLNGSYIAKRFFDRSTCWFSQKVNNHMKNGKPVDFNAEELKVLKNALVTISIELQDLADEL